MELRYVSIPSRRVGDSQALERPFRRLRSVSIPSRRVGDLLRVADKFVELAEFPSPQGGSETSGGKMGQNGGILVSIPSRRVGDDAITTWSPAAGNVSIPSRRVGDGLSKLSSWENLRGFHPLKAGRRPRRWGVRFPDDPPFPSPQGGSETRHVEGLSGWADVCFHPLKAGRRPLRYLPYPKCVGYVSIPSRRVGDLNGKIGQLGRH